MAKEIDLTKPLSEDDLRYLVDRGRWDALRENARNLDLPEPNLPSAFGIRAQVPRDQLQNTDAFDEIAKQFKVKTEEGQVGEEALVGARQANAEVSGTATTPETPGGGNEPVDYTKLTVPQLKEEMDKRRQQYEDEGDTEGVELMTYASDSRKDDLVSALQMDDEPDDGDND